MVSDVAVSLVVLRYAVYALVVATVYVVGLPLAVFTILYRRRHKLHGDAADPFVATTRATYGFLYMVRAVRMVVDHDLSFEGGKLVAADRLIVDCLIFSVRRRMVRRRGGGRWKSSSASCYCPQW